ncbi:zinc finger and BTB domain-containing protein 40 isoform X2 [Stigmatopora nigra]
MIELPNYSSQLMHQLWALRKEGHLCDCTVLVGDNSHRAHKLVLAASSMLFRSLLDLSDTVSIDTNLVSSQEFSCLLDMVYTGKLPLGKHNVTRIIAAADNLQMFDVAVSFKSVLANVINQQSSGSTSSMQTQALKPVMKVCNPEVSVDSPNKGGHQVKDMSDKNEYEDTNQNAEEPPCKKVCSESSDPEKREPSESAVEENNSTTSTPQSLLEEENAANKSTCLELTSRLTEQLNSVSDVVDLLKQSADSALDEQERDLVYNCCKEADQSSIVKKLLDQVETGLVSEQGLLKLLHTVQQKAPSQVETLEKNTLEEDGHQSEGNEAELLSDPEQETSSITEVKLDQSNEKESDVEDKDEYSPNSKSYCCCWCKKKFTYKCRFLAHTKRCPLSKECRVQCPQCPVKLSNQRALQGHLNEAHPDAAVDKKKKKVACEFCGRTFAHPSGLIYHKRTEHFDEKPYACETCGAKFPATSSLKNHMRLHTGEKPYQCKHCDMSFAVAAALAYHTKKKHSEGKMYVCQYCKAVFAQSIELTRHVRTHTGDKPYVCRECGKGHSQASGLTTHLQTSHNMSQPLNCQKCCLTFQSVEEIQKHMEEIHLKGSHKCPTCSKVFSCASLLEKHKSVHTGMKPFVCTICQKSYQQLSGLWYHNRTNHPEVYANQTRQLKTLVQCDVCFRFFPCVSSLAKHIEIMHNGSATSSVHCPQCNVAFGRPEELLEHVCSQHPESGNSFICPLCSKISISHEQLQEHILLCHMESQGIKDGTKNEQMITVHEADGEAAESTASGDQTQPAVTQQVLLALTGEEEGGTPVEVLEVNMYDLLDNSVTTLVCEEKTSEF